MMMRKYGDNMAIKHKLPPGRVQRLADQTDTPTVCCGKWPKSRSTP